LHRDSLGSEQLIRAGQLNLMTSGHGVAHSEENPGLRSARCTECSCGSRNLRRRVTVAPNSNTLTPCQRSRRRTSRRRSSSVPSQRRVHRPVETALWSASNSIFTGSRHSRTGAELRVRAHRRQRLGVGRRHRRATGGAGVPRRGTRRVPFRFKCSESGDAHRGRSLRRTPLHVVELCGEVQDEISDAWRAWLRVTIVLVVSPRRSRASK